MGHLGPLVGIFGVSFAVGFTGAVVPGPMLAATMVHARVRGWTAGVLVSAGHGALELLMLAVIVLGVSRFLGSLLAARVIAVAGGAFLACMGLAVAIRPPEATLGDDAGEGSAPSAARWWRPLLAGVWTSASQPYFTIWWVAVGAGFVLQAFRASGYAGLGAFFVGHVLADAVWFTAVAAAVGAGRRLLSDRTLRRVVQVCGVAMLVFGVLFFAWGALFPGRLAGGD